MSIEIPDTNTLKQEMLESYRREGFDERIINAMAEVPREEFVPERLKKYAYMEIAMPLGEWDSYISTISQPWVVARMCQLLDLNGEEKVLEVGTGSGYHAAVLSRLSKEVVTVECIPDLAQSAKERLSGLGYENVKVIQGDGKKGYKEGGPYDRIIIEASGKYPPLELIDQLADVGVLLMPIKRGSKERLVKFRKVGNELKEEFFDEVTFIELK